MQHRAGQLQGPPRHGANSAASSRDAPSLVPVWTSHDGGLLFRGGETSFAVSRDETTASASCRARHRPTAAPCGRVLPSAASAVCSSVQARLAERGTARLQRRVSASRRVRHRPIRLHVGGVPAVVLPQLGLRSSRPPSERRDANGS